MRITLKLFATLRDYLPPDSDGCKCNLELEDNTSIKEVIESLNIPSDLSKIIFVNGRHKETDYILKDEDELSAFPPIAGG